MHNCLSFYIGCGLVVITASAASAQAPYSPPRTSWGDPDLQAIWSGDSAFGIPMQRPVALGTKRELTATEFAEKVQRDERTRKTAENAILQGLGGERAEDRAVEDDRKKGIVRPRRPIQGGLTVGGQPIPESGPPASTQP